MTNIDRKEIIALIKLIDDDDHKIVEHVVDRLLSYGSDILPILTEQVHEVENENQKDEVNALIAKIKLQKLEDDLHEWKASGASDLLKGLTIVAQYGYPNLDENQIFSELDEIETRVRQEIEKYPTHDQITILTDTMVNYFGFNGSMKQDSTGDGCYINKVLENKEGYPILLSCIYLILAERLDLNLVGINSPRHFIVAKINDHIAINESTPRQIMSETQYFIDPFRKGVTYNKEDVFNFLNTIKFDTEKIGDLYATNAAIIRRTMNNVIYSIYVSGEKQLAERLLKVAESIY